MADPSLEEYEDALAAASEAEEPLMPRRPLEGTEMDITPMIDITFLLLIFFLVASKLDEGATIALPPAKYGIPVPAKNAVVLTVDMGEAEGPAAVYKGNSTDANAQIDSSDLEVLENEITEYVEAEVRMNRMKQYVLIKAAEKVKHRDVNRVARAAGRAAEIQQLHVAVLEVQ
jgi:biopolymer transport protein ExbD